MNDSTNVSYTSSNFITDIIDKDLESGKNGGKVITRFPPEPNGYLHIGHAKSICLNSGLADKYQGTFNLRFDDTNPEKEDQEYVDSIMEDIKWLGADFKDNLFFASDYFDKMYDFAIELIKKGKAYVDDLTSEEMREYRGTLKEPGKNSPYRDRSVEENLELFEKMKNGEFESGSKVLRAKIDMASPNMNLRDPAMYRIQNVHHHRQGDKWCIYPMYDWAHGIEDALEGVTHSICTLEFEDHRPLYDWFLEQIDDIHRPQQIEFAKLVLSHTVLGKRKLIELVEKKIVSGWDDPRMPTVSGMRRRGYPANALRKFLDAVGVAKSNSTVEFSYLEHFIREDLDENAPRAMAIIDPLKVIVTNYPEDQEEWFESPNHPKNPDFGKRKMPFSKELYIERADFEEVPPPKYKRLTLDGEVRFQNAYYLKCTNVVKDENGKIIEIHCEYDPETRTGWFKGIRKVKGTIHWVSAKHAVKAKANIYNNFYTKENPSEVEEGKTWMDNINPESLIEKEIFVEPSLAESKSGDSFQFLRNGFFTTDYDSTKENPIFNRTVALKDTWAKK